ncbi:MAG: HlyD family efflux transporter periplasmic adaptor subunit [Muribaculaceae bacterium]|nr:HlyD family efflux transporter periplasmic adaptor subunit [Muribaculaceae bacterium]MDE6007650.1 HlyD family efflux transporter periplasmic adaptor subunit [Muribaculaceae bacterium]MDE6791690.1 HlyD family efflux transporter periplasmic adaptor subunit [Muribaculaceae bacterium]
MATIQTPQTQPDFQSQADKDAVSAKDRTLILTIVIVLLVIAGLAIFGFLAIKQGPDTIQGQADATEVRISGKLPGRVAEFYVEEGAHVKTGDTLVKIHSSLVDARLAQAQAMEEAAAATNARVDAGTRSQIINSAMEVWKQAQAASGIAQKTYQRMQNLFEKGVVSEQKRDEAKAAYQAATAGEAAAKSQYDLARAGAQKEEKMASQAMVNVAKGSVKEVEAILEDQYLVAPCDGEITDVYPNVSELVATGAPIMTLQKDDHWVVFNVRETVLKDIKLGTEIKVYIPALDIHATAKVFYIRDLGTYANWQATKSTGDFDARTFQVKARPTKKVDNLRPGMSVILEQ